ncbi:MAG: hypothetical protein K6C08_04365 [Oscillospiraceae bacterium]|nr:hypothetical protein [Oscillospiraceae bacterium]
MFEQRLKARYESYLEQALTAERNRKPGEGLFGIGKKPSDDPCHDQFVADLEAMLTEFGEAAPSSKESASVLHWIYEFPRRNREPQSAYWVLLAVQKLTLPLIERLDSTDRTELLNYYKKAYPRWERLPVQDRILEALKKQKLKSL